LLADSIRFSSRHGDAVNVTPISERRPTVDTPITLDDQHSISSLTSLRHCSHGDDVTGNCRLANCDKTSRDRGIDHIVRHFRYTQSMDFTMNRFLMKLFKTSNMKMVNYCQTLFGCELPSTLLKQRFRLSLLHCNVVFLVWFVQLCSYRMLAP